MGAASRVEREPDEANAQNGVAVESGFPARRAVKRIAAKAVTATDSRKKDVGRLTLSGYTRHQVPELYIARPQLSSNPAQQLRKLAHNFYAALPS